MRQNTATVKNVNIEYKCYNCKNKSSLLYHANKYIQCSLARMRELQSFVQDVLYRFCQGKIFHMKLVQKTKPNTSLWTSLH